MPRKKQKSILSYVHPLLLKISKVLGVMLVISLCLVYAGYRGIGPLDWLFSPPEINLLVEDTGSAGYVLYQTPRQATKKSIKGFAINKKTGKRITVKNISSILLAEQKPPIIPNQDYSPNSSIKNGQVNANLQSYFDNYPKLVSYVSTLLTGCQAEGRDKGKELSNCLCEDLDCKNPTASGIAAKAANVTEGDGAIDCVELISIFETTTANPLTACSSQTASGLNYDNCSKAIKKNPEDAINNYNCSKPYITETGFRVGDDIREEVPYQIDNSGHITVCVKPSPDGASCEVCESNRNKDGKVSCGRVVKKNDPLVIDVWRKYDDGNGQCKSI